MIFISYVRTCHPCTHIIGLWSMGPHHLPATSPHGTGILISSQFRDFEILLITRWLKRLEKRNVRLIASIFCQFRDTGHFLISTAVNVALLILLL